MSRCSRTTTSKPRSASSCAAVRPATPPPSIATRVMRRRYTVGAMRAQRGQRVLGAAAAALLLAIVAFAASSSGVKGVPEAPTPQPTPATERELFGGSLQPGLRYHTRAFIPQLSFVASDTEWMVDDATRTNSLVIA